MTKMKQVDTAKGQAGPPREHNMGEMANSSPPLQPPRNSVQPPQDFPPTPVSRSWGVQINSARDNYPDGRRLANVRIQSCNLRRSMRQLMHLNDEDGDENPQNLNDKLDIRIRRRMKELQSADNQDLRRELAERGKIKVTPENKAQRPTYDLQNPESVVRRFVDDEAARLLDQGEDRDFHSKPGFNYLARTLFGND